MMCVVTTGWFERFGPWVDKHWIAWSFLAATVGTILAGALFAWWHAPNAFLWTVFMFVTLLTGQLLGHPIRRWRERHPRT